MWQLEDQQELYEERARERAKQIEMEVKPIKEPRAMNPQIKTMTDDELTQYTHKMASLLSHYNAAEGEMYFKEEHDREDCRHDYKDAREEMDKRGLEWVNRNYLI